MVAHIHVHVGGFTLRELPPKVRCRFCQLHGKNRDADDNKRAVASISSSGGGVSRPTGSLGKPSKKRMETLPMNKTSGNKPLSKIDRQRTANGTMDSSTAKNGIDPADQSLQIVRGTRGNKMVTIIRGMSETSVERKKEILKTLKTKLGVGGTLVDGVLELQGDHTLKVVEMIQEMGYAKAKRIGK